MLSEGKSIISFLNERNINQIAIWGRGNLFELLYRQLEDVEITAIIESNIVEGSHRGIPVVNISKVPNNTQIIIIIPVYDI